MHIIINAEPLQAPLTGIGLYIRHLVEEHLRSRESQSVRCFFRGRLIEAEDCLARVDRVDHKTTERLDKQLKLIYWLTRATTLPYRLYTHRNRSVFRRETETVPPGSIYHEPNYILNPFTGPTVVTVHDLSVLRYPEFHPKARVCHLTRNLERSLSRASHVITDSHFIRAEVLDRFSVTADRVHAIHLGVSEAFQPMPEGETRRILKQYGLTHGHYVLCVATREPRKNLNRLIEAFAGLAETTRREHPLVLVGSRGWGSDGGEDKLQKLMERGETYALGYVPRGHLPSLYAGATVFAFPSLYEGFGLPVLEAMACGTPVITSANTAMSEIAADAALQINAQDSEALHAALEQVLDNEELRAKLGRSGPESAKAFTWEACARQHWRIYERALADQ